MSTLKTKTKNQVESNILKTQHRESSTDLWFMLDESSVALEFWLSPNLKLVTKDEFQIIRKIKKKKKNLQEIKKKIIKKTTWARYCLIWYKL